MREPCDKLRGVFRFFKFKCTQIKSPLVLAKGLLFILKGVARRFQALQSSKTIQRWL